MKLYYWSSFIALLLHSSCHSARIDSDYDSGSRQPRQNGYRGNFKYQVPAYLNPDAYARTLYSTDQRNPDGSFGYEYHTDNGISAKQDSDGYGANKVVRGYYSYVGSDGVTYTVNYIADRFGYRAYGAHLPTQPDAIYDQTRFPVYNRPANNPSYNTPINNPAYNTPINNPAYNTPINNPVYNTPVNRPYYVASTPAPLVHPLNNQNHQHQTQSVYYPQASLASQPIYVTEQAPSNFISITPKPQINNRIDRFPSSTILPPSSILPPHNFAGSSPPYSWTTARPAYNYNYNGGFSSTTSRPY